MVFFYLVLVVVDLFLADLIGGIAEGKGHRHSYYRNLCFFTGIFGYLVVLGLKDLNLKKQNDEIIKLLSIGQKATSNANSDTFEDLPNL